MLDILARMQGLRSAPCCSTASSRYRTRSVYAHGTLGVPGTMPMVPVHKHLARAVQHRTVTHHRGMPLAAVDKVQQQASSTAPGSDADEAARCRALWANKSMADVLVVFTKQPEAVMLANSTEGRSKESSSAANGHHLQWPKDSVVLEAHQAQLYRCSEYFKQQLEGSTDSPGNKWFMPMQHVSGMAMPKRLVIVGVEGQEELGAAENLLRLMYQHDVCQELQGRPEALLQLCLFAIKLQARSCALACADALAELKPADVQPTFMDYLVGVVDSGRAPEHVLPQLKVLAGACSDHMLRDFWDAGRLANDKPLLQAFCALPLPLLSHWVASDKLHVHSENTIVWLLHAWYKAQLQHQLRPDALHARMQPLAAHVRVHRLSPAIIHEVLPQLPWFGPKEHWNAVITMAYSGSSDAAIQSICKELSLPSVWFLSNARAKPSAGSEDECTVEVKVSEGELADAIKEVCANGGRKTLFGQSRNIRGFQLRGQVRLEKDKGDAEDEDKGSTTTGLRMSIFLGYDSDSSLFRNPVLPIEFKCTVGTAHLRTPMVLITETRTWGWHDALSVGTITTIEPLAQYMTHGELRVVLQILYLNDIDLRT